MNAFFAKYFIASIFLLLCLSVHSQNQRVDSLEKAYLSSSSLDEKYEVLLLLHEEYESYDQSKVLPVTMELMAISEMNGYRKAKSLTVLAGYYHNRGIGDSAYVYYQQVQDYVSSREDSACLSIAYNNMAVIQMNSGNYSSCLELMLKSADVDQNLNDLSGATMSYMNVGAIYLILDSLDYAEKYLLIAEKLAIQIDDKQQLSGIYSNLGYLGLSIKDYEYARKYNQKSIEIAKLLGDDVALSTGYRNLAEVYVKKGMYLIAIEYDILGLEHAIKSNNPEKLKNSYFSLALSYEAIGDYKRAYENYKLSSNWEDTLVMLTNRENLLEVQEKYNSEKTEKENEILLQESQIKDLELEKNNEELLKSRIIIWSSIFGLVLLVILAFTLYNRNRIKQLANQALQDANDIINEKNKDITASIEYASKIQEALLPTRENNHLFNDSFILLQPKDIVSGDFYWYARVDNIKIIAAVDCTGHGVPGAFMSMIGNTFLHEIVNEKRITEPGKILDELRKRVIRALSQEGEEGGRRDGMDMALCAIDEDAMTLEFAGANNPVYIAKNGEITEIKGDKQPVGYMPEKMDPFTNHSVKIAKGDAVYIFSDGYADQFGGPKGKKFMYKRFKELILSIQQLPMESQLKSLDNTIIEWMGELEQLDDICVMGIRV